MSITIYEEQKLRFIQAQKEEADLIKKTVMTLIDCEVLLIERTRYCSIHSAVPNATPFTLSSIEFFACVYSLISNDKYELASDIIKGHLDEVEGRLGVNIIERFLVIFKHLERLVLLTSVEEGVIQKFTTIYDDLDQLTKLHTVKN